MFKKIVTGVVTAGIIAGTALSAHAGSLRVVTKIGGQTDYSSWDYSLPNNACGVMSTYEFKKEFERGMEKEIAGLDLRNGKYKETYRGSKLTYSLYYYGDYAGTVTVECRNR